MIYHDGQSGNTMMKRFPVSSITRGKDYSITKSDKGSKVLYFTANPNGEAETVTVYLKRLAKLKILRIDIDFAELSIKGKSAGGNIVTKHKVNKVELKSVGVSTLSAREIWFDDTVQRLNVDKRGDFLGAFKPTDRILTIMQSGEIELKSFDLTNHFDDDMINIEKNNFNKPISVIYFDGNKKAYYIKRFLVKNTMSRFRFISDHKDSRVEIVSTDWRPQAELIFVKEKGKERRTEIINIESFISVKGEKALGNKLTSRKVKEINLLKPLPYDESLIEEHLQKINKDKKDKNLKIQSDIKLEITNELKEDNNIINEESNDENSQGQITLEL